MDFTEFLTNNPVVLDGAMSTPLEKLGADTNNDLWTAKALIDNEELVYEVHKMYFEAGAFKHLKKLDTVKKKLEI